MGRGQLGLNEQLIKLNLVFVKIVGSVGPTLHLFRSCECQKWLEILRGGRKKSGSTPSDSIKKTFRMTAAGSSSLQRGTISKSLLPAMQKPLHEQQ